MSTEMMIGRGVGMLVGVIVGLLICFIAFKLMNKDGRIKTEYDERQKEIRGRGYAIAFWVMSAYLGVMLILSAIGIELPIYEAAKYFTGFFFGGGALVIYCGWNGAYFGLNSNKNKWLIFIAFFGILNLFICVMQMRDDGFQAGIMNLECGLLLVAAISAIVIKGYLEDKEDTEDEES